MPVTDLPEFPWDSLVPYRSLAAEHPGGVVDLSVGTPVDPTPALLRSVLAGHADAPGYPTVAGTADLRDAVVDWFARVRGVPGLPTNGVMPCIGSKELIAGLPTLLGLGAGDLVVHPEVAYPTYDIGARLAGATPVPADGTVQVGPGADRVRLVWLNSPGNPTGQVLGVEHLAKVVAWARERGAVVVSDECYCDLGWGRWDPSTGGEGVPSVLDPRVTGGDLSGVLSVCSTSKRSNLAGYRAGVLAGDPALVQRVVAVRRHSGMIVPSPVQAVLAASLRDDTHVAEQKARYGRRREALAGALRAAGLRIDGSEGGLYLWASRGEDCWDTVGALACLGVLVAPGAFYGPRGRQHVRVALTATDDAVTEAVDRLDGSRPGTNG